MKSGRFSAMVILSVFLFFFSVSIAWAYDTDLYVANGEGVEANLLVIFDNSGSMNEEVKAHFYDPSVTYDPTVVPQANRDTVYYRILWGGWGVFASSIADVACSTAQTALANQGHYEGFTNSNCSRTYRTLRTGNYRNYLASVGGDEYLPKLTIAKRVIKNFLDTVNGVRMGVMIFNQSEGGRLESPITSLNDTTRNQLKNAIDNIEADTWTPLAETLYEAGLYFEGRESYFNPGVVYTSPIQYHCQRNYVILITDGEPTEDRNSILATVVGDRDGDRREPPGAVHDPGYPNNGSDYLDDVAKYLYDMDLRSDLTGQQNIATYTIGFTMNSTLLERTATQGHGTYFYTDSAQNLSSAFQNIIDEILSRSSSFVAPIVPVSRMERTTAGDKIYLALFKPIRDRMWSGNIKKYGVAQQNNPSASIHIGDILDVSGSPALDSTGQFFPTSRSYWTGANMDGVDVEKGGVGELLVNRGTPRNLYTYLGSNVNLRHSSNAFGLDNADITPSLLGLSSADTTGRNKLIQFVHGYDAYDDNANRDSNEKRDWILGAFLHSRPLVVHYATRSVIFAGSNDGMMHAFDDTTGEELWGFIPHNLLNRLQALHMDVLQSFVDGSAKAYTSTNLDGSINRVVLVFGQRRGGNRYDALDVTDPLNPQFLWQINPSSPGFEELGQSWSVPNLGKIAHGTGEKWVFFIGGGYDENQDNDPVTVQDSKGRAIYVVDALTGALLWRYSHHENSMMAYSVPSDIARLDSDGDGKIDRLYVGDMGGRIWRVDIKGSNSSAWTGRIIFQSNPGSSDKRKVFYPPDVTLENQGSYHEMLFFGTGDREHPKDPTVINRLYAVRDRNAFSVLSENDLVDVTEDLLQDPNASEAEKDVVRSQLVTGTGWIIKLDSNPGEKSLSPAVVFNNVVYFTTFTPTAQSANGDPCYVGEGTARIYMLRYNTGNAAFNLDLGNDLGETVVSKADRATTIGTAIPSGVVVTLIQGTAVAYTGVGGGVYKPMLSDTREIIPIDWQIVF